MYSNNREYRQAIRDFFHMNPVPTIDINDCDEETYDELLFDEAAMSSGMTDILQNTDGYSHFDVLYELAAAKLFSVKKDTGLCVLLTYDFFADFISLYSLFIENKDAINDQHPQYIALKEKLSNK